MALQEKNYPSFLYFVYFVVTFRFFFLFFFFLLHTSTVDMNIYSAFNEKTVSSPFLCYAIEFLCCGNVSFIRTEISVHNVQKYCQRRCVFYPRT